VHAIDTDQKHMPDLTAVPVVISTVVSIVISIVVSTLGGGSTYRQKNGNSRNEGGLFHSLLLRKKVRVAIALKAICWVELRGRIHPRTASLCNAAGVARGNSQLATERGQLVS
jgi:hypothetical protein